MLLEITAYTQSLYQSHVSVDNILRFFSSNSNLPSIPSILANVRPILLSRYGERVEKTPTLAPFSLGGLTLAFL